MGEKKRQGGLRQRRPGGRGVLEAAGVPRQQFTIMLHF